MQRDSNWTTQSIGMLAQTQANRFWVMLFLFLSLLACVLGALVIPVGLGMLAGYQDLQTQNHESAILHFNRGLGYLSENYPELARVEFEIALKYDNTFEPAKQKLAELMPRVSGTPANPDEQIAATLLDEARGLVAQKDWDGAITRLEQLRTLRANYRTAEVADLLYQAYVGGGKAAVSMGQIELARGRFEAALAIRNDPEIVRQRDLAVLYLDGQQAVGYNWQTAIQKFSALYQQDPNYDDVKKRLFDAYVNYAELAAKQNSPCLAEREYNSALALMNDATVAQKRAQVVAQCRQAISSPPTPVSGANGENYTWKISTGDGAPCTGIGDISGAVRDALGRLLTGVSVGYYADGIPLTTTKTNANGQYQFQLGKDAGIFHVVMLGGDGKTPANLAADVPYPGGANAGCHIVVDWQRGQ
jgi:tetratricopeptide (TPR) repeat protein